MKKQGSSFDWRKVGAEVGAIVFAVLLALWLEGWREDVERQERADLFLNRIKTEVQENRDDLRSAMTENQAYIDGLKAVLDSEQIEFTDLMPFIQAESASTQDAAWQSAQMTQTIANMPADAVASLAKVYDLQDEYVDYMRMFFQRFIDMVMEMRAEESRELGAQRFRQHLSVSNSLAEQLLTGYDAFLATHGLTTKGEKQAAAGGS